MSAAAKHTTKLTASLRRAIEEALNAASVAIWADVEVEQHERRARKGPASIAARKIERARAALTKATGAA